MFKINLKIAFRNLLRNKVYAAINIGGLALGLTAFVLLLLFVNHETSYDQWAPDLSKIYQIREKHDFFTPDTKAHFQEIGDTRIGALVRNTIPQFTHVTKIDQAREGFAYALKVDGQNPIMVSNVREADSAFFKVFPFEFVQGNGETALSQPNSMVIREELAQKIFGTDKVLGRKIKTLAWRDDQGNDLTITGVVAATKTPSSVDFNAISYTGYQDKDPDNIGSSHYAEIYALANTNLDTNNLNKTLLNAYVDFKKSKLKQMKMSYEEMYPKGSGPGLKAVKLQEVHHQPVFTENWFTKLKPIIALCLFLLLVSVINFVNLATAQSVQRAKEVGVKKVLGAYRKQLIVQFLLESAIQSLSALFICVVLVEMLLPSFSNQFNVSLSFWHNHDFFKIACQLGALFLILTLLAGFYPAWVLSKYNPVKVLKGNYETAAGGISLRNILVVGQFIIAVTFMIGVGVMRSQTNYVSKKDLGFTTDRLVNIKTNYNEGDQFVERLKKIPGVKSLGTSTQVMGNVFNSPREIIFNGKTHSLNSVSVSTDALQTLGVKLLKGRLFAKNNLQDTVSTAIVNETGAKLLGKDVLGKTFFIYSKYMNKSFPFQIVGIIKDYHNEGFDKAVLPTFYKVAAYGGNSSTNNLLIRFDNDHQQEVMKRVEKEWQKAYPNYPMQYVFAADTLTKELEGTTRLYELIMLFSGISIVLSLLGLFALSTFVAKRRTKEIAIRKILGASDFQIINMLNRSFLILVLLANLISWPVAYVFTNRWLAGFAYRIDMPVWPFLIATVASLVVALFTVSLQARKAALNSPVESLKYE